MFNKINIRNSLFAFAAAVVLTGVSAQGAVAGSGANDPALNKTGATELANKENVRMVQGRVGRIFIAGASESTQAEFLAENRTRLGAGR